MLFLGLYAPFLTRQLDLYIVRTFDNPKETCVGRMESILDWGLIDKFFEPMHTVLEPLPEPMSVLRTLYASQKVCSITSTSPTLAKLVAEAINCQSIFDEPVPLQLNLTRWDQLQKYMNSLCQYIGPRTQSPKDLTVLVIGAGPVGLLHALEAAATTSKVTIVEKRWRFSRNMWFDLGPSTWYPTLNHVSLLGFQYLEFEHVLQSGDEDSQEIQVMTMRCQTLQNVLAKTAFLVGIDFLFGATFESYLPPSDSGKQTIASIRISNDEVKLMAFDFLFAADGASSLARKSLDLTYNHQTKFLIDGKLPVRIDGLAQPTLLINLKPNEDKTCPKQKKALDGLPMESHETGMVITGISHVFKRFYLGHCHLQVLFTQEKAKELGDLSTVPWQLLLDVTTFLFETPYESIEDLQAHVIQREANGGQEYDFDFFSIEIKETQMAVLKPPLWETHSIVSIIGDASITAHYRMGVGVNNGVRQLENTRKLLKMELGAVDPSEVERLNAHEMAELTKLHRFEAFLIGMEAYCDFVVGLEATKSRYSYSTMLRMRDLYKNGKSPQLLKIEGLEHFANCQALE